MAQDDDDKGVSAGDVAGGAVAGLAGAYGSMAAYGAHVNHNVAKEGEDELTRGVKKAAQALVDRPVEGKDPIPGLRTKHENYLDEVLLAPEKDGKLPASALKPEQQALLEEHVGVEGLRKAVSDGHPDAYKEAIETIKEVKKDLEGDEKKAAEGLIKKLESGRAVETQWAVAEDNLGKMEAFAESWKDKSISWLKKPFLALEHAPTATKLVFATAIPLAIGLGATWAINAWRNSGQPEPSVSHSR